MVENFGSLSDGTVVSLYTIQGFGLTAKLCPLGATLVRLYVPDRDGQIADVVLGYPDAAAYERDELYMGATVGRCANRIKGGSFQLKGQTVTLEKNDHGNSLHSGPNYYTKRLWTVAAHTEDAITFYLDSPDGDQGFPGRAQIRVTYRLIPPRGLEITYEAVSDRDTVFNMTHHSCFNLKGHQFTQQAMEQLLTLPADTFLPSDETLVPTGELRSVEGTPMDFRKAKALRTDIGMDYPPLLHPKGYDSTFINKQPLCAVLTDPISGRQMSVYTDMPGVHLYSGNFIHTQGKDGVYYDNRPGVALETQFYPDAVHHPQWPQPIAKAGVPWCSRTTFAFDIG